jgi:hypothetical protein
MTAPFEISVICPVLIGRTSQLDLLDRVIAEAFSGHGQTVLIAGEAGIGKSRLTAEASARFRAHQAAAGQLEARILRGRCFEPDRVLPYAPLLDVLRADLATRSPAEIAMLFGPASATLTRLLPEFAELLPSSTPHPPIEPEQDQRQLTLALVRCFSRLGAHPGDIGLLYWSETRCTGGGAGAAAPPLHIFAVGRRGRVPYGRRAASRPPPRRVTFARTLAQAATLRTSGRAKKVARSSGVPA